MRFYALVLLLCPVLWLQGQAPMATTFDAILRDVVPDLATPGVTVGVVKDGRLIYHNSRGCMNLEYALPFNDSTVFGLASVTKQFTAACIGLLEQQGKLSVRDDVRRYLPELAFYEDTIRIQHLLTHTSGIRNHNVLLDLQGFDYAHRGYTNAMIEALMFRQSGINNPPGTKMLYANTNYVLLALIVERVSGQPLHEFAQTALFAPLGMTQSFYKKDLGQLIPNRAYSYQKKGPVYSNPPALNHCIGAGGMLSTVEDLSKWMQVFLDPAHPYAHLKTFLTHLDTLNNGIPMKHARGIFVAPYEGHLTFNHSGRDRGMRSQFIVVPDLQLGVVVYTNSNMLDAVGISYRILDAFIPPAPAISTARISGNDAQVPLATFQGVYQELNSDLRMIFSTQQDTLMVLSSFGRQAIPLRRTSSTTFQRMDNPAVSYNFGPSGDAALEIDFGGAIFYFETIQLDPTPNENLEDYVGDFYSEELDVTYALRLVDGELLLSYPNNANLVLKEGATDTFGANRRTQYAFRRNMKGRVVGFEVASEGTVKGILFERKRS